MRGCGVRVFLWRMGRVSVWIRGVLMGIVLVFVVILRFSVLMLRFLCIILITYVPFLL